MGNNGRKQNSSSNYGTLYVRTDKPYYFSGEQVTGTIYCNITQNGYYGNVLYLKVKGFEKCNWEESRQVQHRNSNGSRSSKTVHYYYHGKSILFGHKTILYTFNEQYLQPGQFAFPFTFTLFGHLPGSFLEKGYRYSASIIYKVKGEIESFSKDNQKMKHTQELIVREPLKQQLASMQGEMTVQAKTWCCISQGTSKIKCVFDKNAYLPGDQATIKIDIDNSDCQQNVKEIRGILNRTLTLKSTCGRTISFNNEMVRELTQGILARSTAINEQGKNMQIQLINRSGGSNDQYLQPSTNGQVVRCGYQFSSTAVLQGCTCCTSDPSVVLPVNMVSPVPIIYNQVPQVQNWNPQTFEPVLVQNDMYQQNYQGQQNPNFQNMNQNMGM